LEAKVVFITEKNASLSVSYPDIYFLSTF